MKIIPKDRKFIVIECTKQDWMGMKRKGIRNTFSEELTDEMSSEDMVEKHTNF